MGGEPGVADGNRNGYKELGDPPERLTIPIKEARNVLDDFKSADYAMYVHSDSREGDEYRDLFKKVLLGLDKADYLTNKLYRMALYDSAINKSTYIPGYGKDWEESRAKLYTPLAQLLKLPFSRDRIASSDPLSEDEVREAMLTSGYGVIDKLIDDPEFDLHRALGTLLCEDIGFYWWNTYKRYDLDVGHSMDKDKASYNRDVLEKKRQLAFPLLARIHAKTMSKGDKDFTIEMFDSLARSDSAQTAVNILYSGDHSYEDRLHMFVQFSNVFGFIRTIDNLAMMIRNYMPDGVKEQFEEIYKALQGNDVKEIMEDLSQVYAGVDFHHYTLNSGELTSQEADLLDEFAGRVMRKKGLKDKGKLRVLDLGAGTGRLSMAMQAKGYDTTAFEYEAHHAERIRDAGIPVVQGDWHELSKLFPDDEKQNLVFSLGRTLSHNRDPQSMFHVFDEVQAIEDKEGIFIFDQPNVGWGVYRDRVGHLRENLTGLGIKIGNENLIYDGPDDEHKFNRMVLRPEQVDALARLTGFRLDMDVRSKKIEGESIENIYYVLEKDDTFDPAKLDSKKVLQDLKTLGIFTPETDFNVFVKAWDMTLGQAILFGFGESAVRQREDIKDIAWAIPHAKVLASFSDTGVLLTSVIYGEEFISKVYTG